jgi:hypothetical protein
LAEQPDHKESFEIRVAEEASEFGGGAH